MWGVKMKIRNGFVSNSSSSSFIVAAKKGKTTIKMEIEIDLEDYTQHTISNVKELLAYYKDECDGDVNPEQDEDFREQLADGKIIYIGQFCSDGDNMLEQYLCDQGLPNTIESDDVKIIQSEGGY